MTKLIILHIVCNFKLYILFSRILTYFEAFGRFSISNYPIVFSLFLVLSLFFLLFQPLTFGKNCYLFVFMAILGLFVFFNFNQIDLYIIYLLAIYLIMLRERRWCYDRSSFIRNNILTFIWLSCRNYYSICLNYISYIFEQIDNKKHICNLPV